jgi:hypothetical protein
VAQAGTQAGQSRYALCMQAYTCLDQTGCWKDGGVGVCICLPGDAGAACRSSGLDPNGPCQAQEIAGFEVPADIQGPANYVLLHLNVATLGPSAPPYTNTSLLNNLYEYERANLSAINKLDVDAGD